VADLSDNQRRIAQLFRMLGSTGGERRNAFAALERAMQSEGISWSDIGNTIERGFAGGDGKYSEAELCEYGQALRAEGVEAGIKIGLARAGNGGGNGHLTLPPPVEMAQHCHERLGRLRNDNERDFISKAHGRRGRTRSLRELGWLVSLYIQTGGRI
jgi:hypothetical protein